MKKGTDAKVKFKMLEHLLGMETWQVKGLLTSIWDFAATNAPDGAIGRYSHEEIAMGIGFLGNVEPVIDALVKTRWLDNHPDLGLLIHDWAEHCEDSIHVTLARKRLCFADGTMPKLTKLTKKERAAASRAYKKLEDDTEPPQTAASGLCAVHGGKKTASLRHAYTCAMPEPAPKPLPIPAGAAGKQAAGVFSKLTDEELGDAWRLQDWYELATKQRKPVIKATEHNRLMVFASAERAIEHASTGPPMGLFAWLVSEARWDYITSEQEDRARAKMQALDAGGPIIPANTNGFTFPEPRRPA